MKNFTRREFGLGAAAIATATVVPVTLAAASAPIAAVHDVPAIAGPAVDMLRLRLPATYLVLELGDVLDVDLWGRHLRGRIQGLWIETAGIDGDITVAVDLVRVESVSKVGTV